MSDDVLSIIYLLLILALILPGFVYANKNKKVFGVLPFLHLNITENQFKKVLVDSKGNLGESVEKLCNSVVIQHAS